MLVHHFLEVSARKFPDKTALIAGGSRHTYAELEAMADGLADGLASAGLERGDRAAIFLDNSLEAVVSLFAVLKAGGVFIMLNPTMKSEKLSYILSDSGATVLIGPASKSGVMKEALKGQTGVKSVFVARGAVEGSAFGRPSFSFDEAAKSAGGRGPERRPIDADLATIIYTSGSTGAPKGVMMAHYNMAAAAASITEYLENTSEDIIFSTLPVSFDYGLYQVLMAFRVGATVILEKSFMYPYRLLETMIKERVTGFPIVPTMSSILTQMDEIKKMSFPHLRYITNTAAALPSSHITKLREFFPSASLYSMYGLTECKRVSYLPPGELDRRPASVGKAMPNTEAYIVDENGARVGPGVTGELVVRGTHVMRGYWGLPEETAKKLRPGTYPGEIVLFTGDLFKADGEGYLYFVGRKDDIIKSRGEKVSPKEIENVLASIEGVVESAVIGVPDPVLGEAVKAFVVKKKESALTEKEVLAFCSRHLEDHMVPKTVELVEELPKTATGKIDKSALKTGVSCA